MNNGETLFMTHDTWQDHSRMVEPQWGYNEPSYGTTFDPGRQPSQYPSYETGSTAFSIPYFNQQQNGPSQDFNPWRTGRPSMFGGHYSNYDHRAAHGYPTYQPMTLQQHYAAANTLNGGYVPQAPRYLTSGMPHLFGVGPMRASSHVMPHLPPAQLSAFHKQAYTFGQNAPPALSNPMPASHPALLPPLPVKARGPPQKPKRSGHAIWVGNIPMGASIEALKDHFSCEATSDIESVFLMSKSNCAFVNYKSQAACHAAVERFNHSLFGSVRLLCRLRRDTTSHGDLPRSPADSKMGSSRATSAGSDGEASPEQATNDITDKLTGLGIADNNEGTNADFDSSQRLPETSGQATKGTGDRYFILKSLTKEDLQESLQKGTWETQSHNQRILDRAFQSAADVYLVFSVNKSGEYFGYARMISSPFDESAAVETESSPEPAATTSPNTSPYGIRVTSTPSTTTAPKGYIVADASRGTLFWEAESASLSHPSPDIVSSTPSTSTSEGSTERVQSRPFKVEWLSVRRVPFQRVKGMRNPWNSNKEVKIARDGTELETELARRMVGMFHEVFDDRC